MFEKEAFNEWKAEQYKDQSTEERFEFVEHLHTFPKYFKKTFIDGYNKAKEEMQEQGLALQSDMDKTIEQNLQLKKELNKANEWHYVKDGDLPKIGKTCLVYLANGDVITARLREDNVWTTNGHNAFENVIAWKEIVLPKEIEK